MATRDRGRDDDEFSPDDEFDDSASDEFDEDLDDEDLDEESESSSGRAGRSRTAAATSRTTVRSKAPAVSGSGPFGRLSKFVREIVAELQKVIWPTRKELLTYTTVVVAFVAIMMTIVGLLDLGFVKLMFLVFGGDPTTTSTE